MHSEMIDKIKEKVDAMSAEHQEKVLEFVESLEAANRTPWQIWQNHLKEIPAEELDEIPTDGSLNLDHYLYGVPKK